MGAIGVIVILLIAATFAVIRTQGGRKVRNELARIRSNGLPSSPLEADEFYAVPENMVDITEDWIKAIGTESSGPFAGPNQISASGVAGWQSLPYVGTSAELRSPLPGESWAELDVSKALLQHYAVPLQEYHRVAKLKGAVRYPVRLQDGFSALLPYTQALRTPARLARLEALTRAHDGDAQGAAQSLQAILASAHTLDYEPILIAVLVRGALIESALQSMRDLLPVIRFSDEDLRRFQESIRNMRRVDALRRAFIGERAMGFGALENPRQFARDAAVTPHQGMIVGLSGPADQLLYLEIMEEYIVAADKGEFEGWTSIKSIEAKIKNVAAEHFGRLRYPVSLMIIPAMDASFTANNRILASCRLTDTLIAVEQFRRQSGRFPQSIDELVPDLLPERPLDPFSGRDLVFRAEPQRIVIYSLGSNGVDDGGIDGGAAKNDIVVEFPIRDDASQ